MDVLEARKLSKSFEDVRAVNNLSLELNQGEILGLLGPNGAGKTTTMKMLSGLLKTDTGTVEIENSLKQDVAVVFQETDYGSKLTVEEFLQMMSVLNESSYSVEKAIQDTGLEHDKNTYVQDLSGGTKKKLNIASGLLKNPKYLLLDEPTAGLDPRAKKKVWGTVKELSADIGVVVSTHLMDEIEELCDRILIIENGKEVISGSPDQLLSRIQSDFLVKAEGKIPEKYQDVSVTDDNFFEIKTDKPQNVLNYMVESGHMDNLENLTVEKPSLEDVFLELTGRRYSEENT